MQLDLEVIGRTIPGPDFVYDWKTCALYALAIGASPSNLDYVWEGSAAFKVHPSFAVIPLHGIVMDALMKVRADFRTLVHGEQTIRLHRPFEKEGTLHSTGKISAVYDKGKAAVVVIDTETRDAKGDLLTETSWSIFCRGQGGFGGEVGPTSKSIEALPDAPPSLVIRAETRPEQALLYRLCGDLNPIHVDAALATKVGFERPILHGLCTYGSAVRALVDGLCGGDVSSVRRISARFSGVVYPGDTIDLRVVPSTSPGTHLLEARVGERSVLSNGVIELG
ncbi:MAG: MaoC family protein [Myxococcales bacterium]|nr:MaoC family protein [Myxococcales bacterium]